MRETPCFFLQAALFLLLSSLFFLLPFGWIFRAWEGEPKPEMKIEADSPETVVAGIRHGVVVWNKPSLRVPDV